MILYSTFTIKTFDQLTKLVEPFRRKSPKKKKMFGELWNVLRNVISQRTF